MLVVGFEKYDRSLTKGHRVTQLLGQTAVTLCQIRYLHLGTLEADPNIWEKGQIDKYLASPAVST